MRKIGFIRTPLCVVRIKRKTPITHIQCNFECWSSIAFKGGDRTSKRDFCGSSARGVICFAWIPLIKYIHHSCKCFGCSKRRSKRNRYWCRDRRRSKRSRQKLRCNNISNLLHKSITFGYCIKLYDNWDFRV